MRIDLLCAAMFATVALAPPAWAADMFGNWQRGDGNTRVHVSSCGSAMCATNIWVRDPSGEDQVGDVLVLKVRSAGGGRMAGVAHDPQRHLDFDVEMKLKGPRMQTKGCLVGSQICRDYEWTRVR